MTTTIPELPPDADRAGQIATARANLQCRAEAQGVKPFTTLDDFSGDATMTADFDVDEFATGARGRFR